MALVRVVQVNQEKTRERITAAAGVAGAEPRLPYEELAAKRDAPLAYA